MPRRKQDVAGAWGMLAVLFFPVLASLIGTVAFVLIVISVIYFQVRCLRLPKQLTIDYLFDDPAERAQLRSQIANCQPRIRALWDKGRDAGFERTNDGRFDARNPEGRRLNRQITDLRDRLDAASNRLRDMEEVASSRSDNWSWQRSGRFGSVVALIAFITAAVLLAALSPALTPAWLKFLSACSALTCGGIAWVYSRHSGLHAPACDAPASFVSQQACKATPMKTGIGVGDTVRVLWSADGRTYNALVKQIDGDTISVDWEDGTYSERIPTSDVVDVIYRSH